MQFIRKYIFGFLVSAYFFSLVGLPVYFHYCGGQLEEISYFTKANSCCDGEVEEDNGCCRDEGIYLVNSTDLILKNYAGIKLPELNCQSAFHVLPSPLLFNVYSYNSLTRGCALHPPGLHHPRLIETSVLRI